jgi:hypothetical protein
MSNWRGFELLAEQIYRELHGLATVKWNDHIYGRETETLRQIDVSIRWMDADIERLAIVQVKDWKARADITAVGEFSSVVRDIGADKGVMVCRGGFSKTALTYARNIGIELHNLHDAQSKDWSRNLTIPILWIEQSPNLRFEVEAKLEAGDQIDSNEIGYVDLGGVSRNFRELFIERWNAEELPRTAGLVHLYEPGDPVSVRAHRPDGSLRLRPTRRGQVTYTVNERSWLGQFEPAVCRGYVDYLRANSFVATYLPLGEVPQRRDSGWVPISDPNRVAVNIAGTFVTSQNFQMDPSSGETSLRARRLGR